MMMTPIHICRRTTESLLYGSVAGAETRASQPASQRLLLLNLVNIVSTSNGAGHAGQGLQTRE